MDAHYISDISLKLVPCYQKLTTVELLGMSGSVGGPCADSSKSLKAESEKSACMQVSVGGAATSRQYPVMLPLDYYSDWPTLLRSIPPCCHYQLLLASCG